MLAGCLPLVFDASVAAKWVFPESGSAEPRRLLGAVATGRVYPLVPDLLLTEVANLAWKKWSRGEVTAEDADAALTHLLIALPESLPAAPLVAQALQLSRAHRHPV